MNYGGGDFRRNNRTPRRGRGGQGNRGRGNPKQQFQQSSGETRSEPPVCASNSSSCRVADNPDPVWSNTDGEFPDDLELSTCDLQYLFSGASGLSLFIEKSFDKIVSGEVYSMELPEEAYAYFVAAHVYARMLHVHVEWNLVSEEERRFMENMFRKTYERLPSPLADYIAGFGEVNLGEYKFRFQMPEERKYVSTSDADCPHGWFGKIDADNHYMYHNYPCLAVYWKRIIQNYHYNTKEQVDKYWNLPEEIIPDGDAGLPTENLLGWKPSYKLNEKQMNFYKMLKILSLESGSTEVAYFPKLLEQVELLIHSRKPFSLCPSILDKNGSVGQFVMHLYTEYNNYGSVIHNSQVKCSSPIKLDPCILELAAAFRYRPKYLKSKYNDWCIYDWNKFKNVPTGWALTINCLRDKEPDLLTKPVLHTKSFKIEDQLVYFLDYHRREHLINSRTTN